jgi:hypothetical protein
MENRVLRIFGHKKEETAERWKRLHNEELHNLYASPHTVRVNTSIRWAGHVAHMWEMRNEYKISVEKFKGKRPLGKPRHR